MQFKVLHLFISFIVTLVHLIELLSIRVESADEGHNIFIVNH